WKTASPAPAPAPAPPGPTSSPISTRSPRPRSNRTASASCCAPPRVPPPPSRSPPSASPCHRPCARSRTSDPTPKLRNVVPRPRRSAFLRMRSMAWLLQLLKISQTQSRAVVREVLQPQKHKTRHEGRGRVVLPPPRKAPLPHPGSSHGSSPPRLPRLAAYPKQNALAKTLREIGRLERTLFTLDWISDPALRRRASAGLNKGEV